MDQVVFVIFRHGIDDKIDPEVERISPLLFTPLLSMLIAFLYRSTAAADREFLSPAAVMSTLHVYNVGQ